jgi:hypothetical protein
MHIASMGFEGVISSKPWTVGQGFVMNTTVNVANRFGIDVNRVHCSGGAHAPCSPYCEPA